MKISCDACRERWGELFENPPQGAVPQEAAGASLPAELREHLAQCPQCRDEWALLAAAREELHAFPVMPAPGDLRARIRRQLEAEAAASPVTSTSLPEPMMTATEISRHRAQIEQKLLGGSGNEPKATAAKRLQALLLHWGKSLRHPGAMVLSSSAALLLIGFISLSTFRTGQVPIESSPSIAVLEPAENDTALREKSSDDESAETQRSSPSGRVSPENHKAAGPSQKSLRPLPEPKMPSEGGAAVKMPSPPDDSPAIWRVAPPPRENRRNIPAPVPLRLPSPANGVLEKTRRDNGAKAADTASASVTAPVPPAPAVQKQGELFSAATSTHENQALRADVAQADGVRAGRGAEGPQAAMAQRAPQPGGVPAKSSNGKQYLARRRGAAERIEASIIAPRHIGEAQVVVELPEEAQFTDGSRSRVLWRGSVRKDEPIAVKFEAEVEPEAEEMRVVLQETKDGDAQTVAYKDVPLGENGRRRSR